MPDRSIAPGLAGQPPAGSETGRTGASRAPLPNSLQRFLVGTLLARPWFDRATLLALKHLVFPAGRLWAAAAEAGTDVARFSEAVPMPFRHERTKTLQRALDSIAEARATSDAVNAAWELTFFGSSSTVASEQLGPLEAARLTAQDAYNATRWGLRLKIRGAVPRAKMAIETPEAVEAIYGGGLARFDDLSAPPATMPAIAQSRAISTNLGTEYWLRFKSPSARLGDSVYARVQEPPDCGPNTPTLLFGHGVCVEFDHWKGLIDESQSLIGRGFRVVRPEAPWHGRRKPLGRFGGERTIGAFPMGLLDSFSSALQEWAVLADWIRKRSSGPLVFGGSSLGAMTAQLAADRCSSWPSALKPDALFLVTHTGDMAAAVLEGALSNLWANPETVKPYGWTPELARRYLSLVNPVGRLPMPAAHIVSILGRRDVILPFESGRQLVARWAVPPESSFIFDRGHFSVPPSLIRTTAPLDRLCEIAASYR